MLHKLLAIWQFASLGFSSLRSGALKSLIFSTVKVKLEESSRIVIIPLSGIYAIPSGRPKVKLEM